ncbi:MULTISPECIES: phage tail assembly protein [unclassified Cellulosimicrobium]|uniref:Phage tail assembly protein n=1 Tax=Cellulosimicrobium sp. ES-005 TaxID=3163031 RepID=A0AAU8FXT2_9MICO|nr:phage tail assembly protein [Cellulosimicrobium sp. TH-20]
MALSLADIKAAADAKYGHKPITLEDGTTVTLVNPLRLSKDARNVLKGTSARLKEEGADEFEVLADALIAAAKTKTEGKKLVASLDNDVAYAMGVFQGYMEEVQAGEA